MKTYKNIVVTYIIHAGQQFSGNKAKPDMANANVQTNESEIQNLITIALNTARQYTDSKKI